MGGFPSLPNRPLPKTPKGGIWRPPQWAKPAMVAVTVPAGSVLPMAAGAVNPANGINAVSNSIAAAVSYVFDAVLALEHDQVLTKTHHPVQTGASVSSHAYIEPAQLVLNVLMSDVAGSYAAGGDPSVQPWVGSKSKSVSAYQQMLTLQAARIPLTVTTRLRTYRNMLILRVSPREDDKTVTGARFRIEFEQLFIANTQLSPASTRPNDTNSTDLGAVNVQPPSAATEAQFRVGVDGPQDTEDTITNDPSSGLLNFLAKHPAGVNVPGAGAYSSVNTNSLQQLPSPR